MAQPTRAASESEPFKWLGSPVVVHEGALIEIRQHIPAFERRSFALTQPGEDQSRLNERLDTIVRLPFGKDRSFVPVGVVSKDYTLVPHVAVLDVAARALDAMKIPASNVKAELTITEYGERMALSLYLPKEYEFDPGDGHPMALRLECLNSVDGSTRFRALMGWFRFICCNGLIIGVTRSDMRRRHCGEFQFEEIGIALRSGVKEAEVEKQNFLKWRNQQVAPDQFVSWVENDLRNGWGFKAATRAYHIASSGCDVEVQGPFKNKTPTTIPVRPAKPVLGAPPRCKNLFDVSQILAWLAKERGDVQEQLKWREQIPELLKSLN